MANCWFFGKQLPRHCQGEPLVFCNNLEKNIETTQQRIDLSKYRKAIKENIHMYETYQSFLSRDFNYILTDQTIYRTFGNTFFQIIVSAKVYDQCHILI